MRISNRVLIILIAAVFLVCVLTAAAQWLTGSGGTRVVVKVGGAVYGTYDLYTDRTVVIGPEDGSWHNTLQIRDGIAGVVESDCDNQICVNTPSLQEGVFGLIVCLPHGVTVELSDNTAP